MSVEIGLKDVYYALLTADPKGGTPTYAAPVALVGAISANINPNTNSETLYADDGPYEVATSLGGITLELNVADLDLDQQAALLGHTVTGGVLKRISTDVPPWLAIGFKSIKSNGKYRYTWLAKGKFAQPEQKHETKGDAINFQTPMATGTFVKRDADDEWERHIDEDHVDYVDQGATWFTSPLGSADTTPPTISTIVPADGAAGVSTGTTITITFDEAIAYSTIIAANFFLTEVVSGAPVAGALSVNAGRTIVTFTPTAALTGATEYRMNVTTSVTDLAGNHLAAHNHNEFTTA